MNNIVYNNYLTLEDIVEAFECHGVVLEINDGHIKDIVKEDY